MIQIIAGGINIHPYVTAYSLDVAPITSNNSFTAHNGEQIAKSMGHVTTIRLTLDKVPHAVAETIAMIMQAESFEMTYTSPVAITNDFKCTNYAAKPKNADPRQKNPLITEGLTWSIDLTVESVNNGKNVGGGL